VRALLVKGFRNLSGQDSELKDAYERFHKMVDQENGAVRNATLRGVEQLKKEAGATHADVKLALATADRTEQNTKTVLQSMIAPLSFS
jgi:tellurite resistance protein